jgi:predicted nucleotidyltransferase
MPKNININNYSFFEKLTELPFIEEIYLYGSRARGDNTERADIDLAIKLTDDDQNKWHEIMETIESADTLLEIDYLKINDCTNEKLLKNITEDGVLLYEKGK